MLHRFPMGNCQNCQYQMQNKENQRQTIHNTARSFFIDIYLAIRMKFNDLSFVTFFIVLSGIYNHSFITRVNHDDRNFTF